MTQTICGYPSCDCERDPPPDPAYCAKRLPTRELDEGEAWSFCRKVMADGRDVAMWHAEEGYERHSARMDAQAAKRADELMAMVAAALASEREAGRREATGGCVECGGPLQWRCPSCRICQSPAVADQPAAALASEREAGRREAIEEAAKRAREHYEATASRARREPVHIFAWCAEAAIRALPVKSTSHG